MQSRHNEHGVDTDSTEYAAGVVIGILGAFDQSVRTVCGQAISDGVVDSQLATAACNENVGFHWMEEYHQYHGDFGDQLLSTF